MSALGGLLGGGSIPGLSSSSSAAASSNPNINTPVSVVSVNGSADIGAILAGVATLTRAQSEPAEIALGVSPLAVAGGGGGGFPWTLVVVGGVVLWLLLRH